MTRSCRIAMLILAAAVGHLGNGCSRPVASNKSTASTKPDTSAPKTVSKATVPSPTTVDGKAEANVKVEKKPADAPTPTKNDIAVVEQPAEAAPPSEPPAEQPTATIERLLLFGPDFPIVVEAAISIDGKPSDEAFERLLDEVLKAADTDGDGKPTWKEVIASEAFKYGLFGNAAAADAAEQGNMVRLYDGNRNGLLDRSEAPRFITRNAGGGRAFSMRNANYHRHRNRRLSPLRKLLDIGEDGSLDEQELAEAELALKSRDADDDSLLTRADFSTPNPEMMSAPGRLPTLNSRNDPDTAFWLSRGADWEQLLFLVQEHYAFGGAVDAAAFAKAPAMFAELDKSGDGTIDKEEIAGMATIPPHIAIEVAFGGEPPKIEPPSPETPEEAAAANRLAGPSIALAHIAEELGGEKAVVSKQPRRLTLALPGMNVEWFLSDGAQGGLRARAEATLAMYDGDKNGYLESTEAPTEEQGFVGRFEGVDGNRDGKLYVDEIESFLIRRQASSHSQVRARVADLEDAFFAALDKNGDGRLDSREISGAGKNLAAMDQNADGLVGIDEIPLNMAVAFARGDVQQDDALFTIPASAPPSTDGSAPPWFTKTDANRDGFVSEDEFLGDSETLANLDADHDGFVSAEEAKE